MGLSRQEYWSESPFPPPGDLPRPAIKPAFPALQAHSLPLSLLVSPAVVTTCWPIGPTESLQSASSHTASWKRVLGVNQGTSFFNANRAEIKGGEEPRDRSGSAMTVFQDLLLCPEAENHQHGTGNLCPRRTSLMLSSQAGWPQTSHFIHLQLSSN